MRAGMSNNSSSSSSGSTIVQTLTPEAGAILKHAVAEACRRGHLQATPLHVAATLLAAPGSPLRRACLHTHSHPLQCRGLELCFNVALDRLQAGGGGGGGGGASAGYSNALVAALKRAQAHQRRGCPDQPLPQTQPQPPLLAVKVELEQLVISILDDPSVSRIMREAGFSSPQVKTYLEEDLAHNSTPPPHPPPLSQLFPRSASASALRLTPSSNLSFSQHYYYPYPMVPTNPSLNPSLNPSFNPSLNPSSPFINPRIGHLKAQNPAMAALDAGGDDSVRRIVEVLLRRKKKCPILVGEPGDLLHAVIRELILAIESLSSSSSSSPSPFSPSSAGPLRGTTFLLTQLSPPFLLSATKPDLDARFRKLNRDVEMSMPNGAIVHIGDLQWLLDTTPRASLTPTPMPPYKETFCPVEYAAFELGQIYTRHSCSGRVWFIGTASLQTYLRFQALHASVENLWELQPVPITSSTSKLRSNTMESKGTLLDHSLILRTLPFNHSVSEAKPDLLNGFRQQRSELSLHNDENVTITNARSESPHSCSSSLETCNEREEGQASAKALPPWLQRAVPSDMAQLGGGYAKKVAEATRSTDEAPLLKPSGQQATTINFLAVMDETAVKTDLSIGRPLPAGFLSKRCDEVNPDKEEEEEDAVRRERVMKSISSHYSPTIDGAGAGHSLISRLTAQPQAPLVNNYYHPSISSTVPARLMDPNAIKQLYRVLSEKVWWQEEAISCIVNAVAQCRSGLASRRSPSTTGSLRSDTWLLFLGPDRAGKRKMAKALAESVFSSNKAVSVISLSSGQRHNCSKGFEFATTTTRSKLPIDCFAEAIRQNPLSVVLLEDVDEADTVLKANLRFAFESGRLQDSYRREVSLSNSIIVMASSLGRGGGGGEHRQGTALLCIKEEGLNMVPGFGMRLVEANGEKLRSVLFMTRSGSVSIVSSSWSSSSSAPDPSPPVKRRRKADWNTTEDNEEAAGNGSMDCHRSKRKSTGEHLSLDLNLALDNGFKAGEDGDRDGDGDGEEEVEVHITSSKDFTKDIPKDFLEMADAVAVFQAVDFNGIEAAAIEALEKSFFNKLGSYVGALEVDVKVVEQMMAALWWGSLDQRALEKWLFDAAAQSSSSSGLLPRREAAAVVAKLLPVVAAESSGPDVFCFPHNTPFDNNSSVTEEEIPFN